MVADKTIQMQSLDIEIQMSKAEIGKAERIANKLKDILES